MKKIILASKSSSRKKILGDLGYDFDVISSDFDEVFDLKKSPEENAMMLAEGKALSVLMNNPGFSENIIIGVDSVGVDPDGNFLEKPVDRNDAEKMMKNRSGKREILISGICILSKGQKFLGFEMTELFWQTLSEKKIQKILNTDEWKGKCGGIAIEGFTGLHVSEISGNFSTIMGFPVNKFLEIMTTLEGK